MKIKNLNILGLIMIVLSGIAFLYYEIFVVETLSELAMLLVGFATGLAFCVGIALLHQEKLK